MSDEIQRMRDIRELLVKALVVATGATEEAIREAPLTEAIRFRKTLSNTPAQCAPSKFSPGDPVEIRKKNDQIDEIVIRRGDVHIERMSNSGWFMGVEAPDGACWRFWFGAKDGRHRVEFRHTETTPALSSTVCGDA